MIVSSPLAGLGLALGLFLGGCGGATSPEARTPTAPEQGPSATYLMNEGRLAASRGDTVRAEQYIALAIERGFDERRALPLLLATCIKGSRLRAALNYAEPYLRDHPEDAALRYLVATIEVGLGDDEGARRELGVLLREAPDHGEARYLLGLLELEHDAAAATEHLREYLRLEPRGRHAADVRVRLLELEQRREEDARRLGRARAVRAGSRPLGEKGRP